MDSQKLKDMMDVVYDKFPMVLGFVMGLVLIAQGVFEIITYTKSETMTYLDLIAFIIMIVGGSLTLILCRKSQIRCIGFYALSLGSSRLLIRISSLDFENPVSLIITLVFIGMAANLCYTGVSFTRGNVIRRSSMIITSSLLAFFNLILFSFGPTIQNYLDIKFLTYDQEVYMVNFLMYLVLLLLLDSVQIRSGSQDVQHAVCMDEIRGSYRYEKMATINRQDASCLLTRSGDRWRSIDDGFVKSEMVFEITGLSFNTSVIAQVWEGSDDLHLTIFPGSGSVVTANRLKVESMKESEGKLHFYGRTGADFSLIIKEEA